MHAGRRAVAERCDQRAYAQRVFSERLPRKHDALASDGGILGKSGIGVGVAEGQVAFGKPEFIEP